MRSAKIERRFDDLVLGVETCERWNSDDRKVTEAECHRRNRHVTGEAAIATHIDLIVHAMHHRACTQEHPGFEESMGKKMHDRKGITDRTKSCRKDHVTDLRHRRSSERLLDVIFRHTDDGTEHQSDRANEDDDELCCWCVIEDEVGTNDEVDTSGDHRRCVDQRRDWRRTCHRIAEPGLQWELC